MTTPYLTEQAADSPFARWKFEEPSGTTFADDIGAVTATAVGSVGFGNDPPPGGYSAPGLGANFDGTIGCYATMSGVSAWVPQTVEALVFLDSVVPTSSTASPAIFAHNFSASFLPMVLGWNLDGAHQGMLGVGFYNRSALAWRTVHMTTQVATGTLLHIVGVRTGTTTLDLWVNGVNVATGTVTAWAAGTTQATAHIGRNWASTAQVIDGRIYDLALYTTALNSTRVAAHYAASTAVSALSLSTGGGYAVTEAPPHAPGQGLSLSTGGGWNVAAPGLLAVPADGLPWTGYGDVSSQPVGSTGAPAAWWRYVAEANGTLTVDTAGTGWDTVLTVYASNRTTVLASNDNDSGLTAGESLVSLSVTAGTTYYVRVTTGAGATGDDGRYIINATGPRSTDAPPVEFPAPAPPSIPAAGPPPSGVLVSPIRRVSEAYSAPSLTDGRPVGWLPTSVTEADWGNFQVVCNGVDVTYFRGFPVVIESYELHEPFGCGTATITFPGITPHDAVGTGDTSWLIGGYNIAILKGGDSMPIWEGFIGNQVGTYSADRAGYTVDCTGEIWMAETVGHQPRTYMAPGIDAGSMVAVALNLVPHRRILGMAQTITGIKTTQRGSSDTSVIGYVQELLASMCTAGGDQWTVKRTGSRRQYAVALKDRATVTWSVQTGQPGVEINLHLDSTTATNRIFGRGVAPNGYAWAGWVYPKTGIEAAPSYPYGSPSTTIDIGDNDAGTASGTGVTDWQTRMASLGYKVTIDGTYDAADATAARAVQAAKGLTVDGITGPQTWAATFDVGANGASLDGAYRAPLAALSSVTPLLTQADGSFGGANPTDNTNLIVVDRDTDFGDGVTKAEAIRSAQAELARSANPGWVGEVVLRADPAELSKWDIREGSNGTIKGWAGRDVLVHVASVKGDPPKGDSTGSVTLLVDERARDLMTLSSILRRDRDAARNPAMLPPRKQRRSQLRADSVVEYDGESSGGIVPKHALYGGLWTVIRIPVSQAGKVAKVTYQTTGPASPFVLAFFGDAVRPADLVKYVGNPLAIGSDYGPFDLHADQLATLGFIEAIGGPGMACGYDPGYQTSPHTGRTTPVTGKLISSGSWTYQSARPPWLWVAEYSPNSCFISGRIFPAPVDT